jgi:DnaD/phage-associated family protein
MNYIKEINAFYDLMELEPLSASAVNLWHTLLHINNKARWAMEFTVSSTVLKLKGGLSESSFQRARKELVNRGLVECRSRGQNQAPAYQMKRLYWEYSGANESNGEDRFVDEMKLLEQEVNQNTVPQVKQLAEGQMEGRTHRQMNVQANDQVNQEAEALIKQKEIKQKETKQEEDAFVFYQENFGVVSPFVAEDILNWTKDVGELLVIEAMKRSLERNKTSWGYVKSILRSWVKKGIRTVEAARAEMVQMDRAITFGQSRSGEVVPSWFLDQKRKRKMETQEEVELDESEAVDTNEMLKQYLNESRVNI